MNLDRVIKIEQKAKSEVYYEFSTHKSFKTTSTEFNAAINRIKDNLPPTTPRYVHTFIDGMTEVMRSTLHDSYIEFCYQIDGKLYSIRRKSDRFYGNFNISPKELHDKQECSGFYWIDTDKVWFKSDN